MSKTFLALLCWTAPALAASPVSPPPAATVAVAVAEAEYHRVTAAHQALVADRDAARRRGDVTARQCYDTGLLWASDSAERADLMMKALRSLRRSHPAAEGQKALHREAQVTLEKARHAIARIHNEAGRCIELRRPSTKPAPVREVTIDRDLVGDDPQFVQHGRPTAADEMMTTTPGVAIQGLRAQQEDVRRFYDQNRDLHAAPPATIPQRPPSR